MSCARDDETNTKSRPGMERTLQSNDLMGIAQLPANDFDSERLASFLKCRKAGARDGGRGFLQSSVGTAVQQTEIGMDRTPFHFGRFSLRQRNS